MDIDVIDVCTTYRQQQHYQRWYLLFFFSSRRRHTRSKRDWSSDVCSSDLKNDYSLIILSEKSISELTMISYALIYNLISNNIKRSEERRVGKECRSRRTSEKEKEKNERC